MPSLVRYFNSTVEITDLINGYFASTGIKSNVTPRTSKNKLTPRPPNAQSVFVPIVIETLHSKDDPPTLTGLALYLGFQSLEDFESYETRGRYASYLRRARLMIIAVYEKKLHNANASGAIFALKGMGWKEKTESKPATKAPPTTLTVKIIESGPTLAANEKEVVL
jgi:hypothetical protein